MNRNRPSTPPVVWNKSIKICSPASTSKMIGVTISSPTALLSKQATPSAFLHLSFDHKIAPIQIQKIFSKNMSAVIIGSGIVVSRIGSVETLTGNTGRTGARRITDAIRRTMVKPGTPVARVSSVFFSSGKGIQPYLLIFLIIYIRAVILGAVEADPSVGITPRLL